MKADQNQRDGRNHPAVSPSACKWITCQWSVFHGFLKTFFHGWNELPWYIASFYFIDKLQVPVHIIVRRFNPEYNISKFSTSTGLLFKYLTVFNGLGDGFFIIYLRDPLVAFYLKFPLQPSISISR